MPMQHFICCIAEYNVLILPHIYFIIVYKLHHLSGFDNLRMLSVGIQSKTPMILIHSTHTFPLVFWVFVKKLRLVKKINAIKHKFIGTISC